MIYICLSLDPLEYYMHLFEKVYILNKNKLHIFRMIFYRQVSILPVNPDVIPFFKPTSLFSRRNRKNQQSSSFTVTTLNKQKDETGETEFGACVCLRRLRTRSEKTFNLLVFKTMARVLYEKPSIFPNLFMHIINDHEPLQNHRNILIKLVIEIYLHNKFREYAKRTIAFEPFVRNKLNNFTLLLGQ